LERIGDSRILSYEVNGPPAALLRFTRYIGGEPPRALSRRLYWTLLAVGLSDVALVAGLLFFSMGPTDGHEVLLRTTMLILSLILAAQGATGLLRESRERISLWLWVLYALLFYPSVLLMGVYLYMWAGPLGAGAWCAFLVSLEIWDRMRRRQEQS